jgi:uncharacterized protein (TIGR03435 family)
LEPERAVTRPVLFLLGVALAYGQQFEVASVKTTAPGTEYRMSGGPGTSSPGQIVYTNTSLRAILFMAYLVQLFQLPTPQWMDEANFDVVAKVPPGATQDDVRIMLQHLLAERFGLKIHHESRPAKSYVLLLAKAGPKLKPSPPLETEVVTAMPKRFDVDKDGFIILPPGHANMITFPTTGGISRLTAVRQSTAALCSWLAHQLQQVVHDQTGLTGIYDFHLAFATDSTTRGRPRGDDDAPASTELRASDPAPTLLQAVEPQLGLKLEQRTLPVDYLIIDHIERTPIEN